MPVMMDPGFNPRNDPTKIGGQGGGMGVVRPPAQRNPRPMPAQRLNPPPALDAQPVMPPQGVGWGAPQPLPMSGPNAPAPQFPIAGSPVLGGGFMEMLKRRLLAAKGIGMPGSAPVQGGAPEGAFPIPGSPVVGGNMFDYLRRKFATQVPISGAMQGGPSVGFRPQVGLGAFPRNDVSARY